MPRMSFVGSNILHSDAELIAIPVNTIGVLGAGLARQFANQCPVEANVYKSLCSEKALSIGNPVPIGNFLMFPTKQHWKDPSELVWIESGLKALALLIVQKEIQSIALPKLGCGLGGLKWKPVFQLILSELNSLDIAIEVYATMAESIGFIL